MIELLAPGGNLAKAKTAFHFGADAVYVGLKELSLRAFADNFDEKELAELVSYARERGKKVYLTLNIFAKNEDFEKVKKTLLLADKVGVDALIISDPGIIHLANELGIKTPRHLSTQANTLNKFSAKFWAEQSVTRIILARELMQSEIKEISDYLGDSAELEMFAHGAMCISYSGRCLLSNYLTDRESNHGECVQACRWDYSLVEKSRKNEPMDILEDERGTYIMNSRDLNLIEYVPEIIKLGISSLKIEGRMKSEFYVATVVNAYRKAIDAFYNGETLKKEYIEDLDKAGHRSYTTCYFEGKRSDTQNTETSKPDQSYEFIAEVESWSEGEAVVIMRNRFFLSDELEILSPGGSFNKTFFISSMINSKNEKIDDAKIVQERVRINCPYPLEKRDILRRKKGTR